MSYSGEPIPPINISNSPATPVTPSNTTPASTVENGVLYLGFNQDKQCFAVGTESGFEIYNCDPFKERFRRDFSGAGIGIVEMLFRCNILALVGGGKNPKYPPNKVMIWDDYQNKCIAELEFSSHVKAVKLRRDRIVVVLERKVYVYNFATLKPVHQPIETFPNPKGLCALCPNSNKTVLACPGLQKGYVHVELYFTGKQHIITAHNNALCAMALNLDGNLLATASEQGTLVRIFDTQTGQTLNELRRGTDRAEIYSINFSANSDWLCVSSDKGTIHIFALNGTSTEAQGQSTVANPRSSFAFMKDLLPKYFSSEWSFAQFRVPEVRSLCAFGTEKNSVIVVCTNGSVYKCIFDPVKGGECRQESFSKFVKTEEDD